MKRFIRKLFSKVTLVILICILAILTFFFWGWIEKQALKVKGTYLIYKGDQAYSQDNMAKTLEFYQEGLKLYPEHYEAWFNLGNIYAVYEDYFAAVDAYEQAIKHNPKFVMARMNLGIVYSEDLGFFDEAIDQFDTITQLKIWKLWIPFVYSNVKSVRANRGIAYYNKGVAYKQKAVYLPLEKKYLAYQFLGDAIEAYTKSLKFLKKNYDVYYNRAVAHHLRGEYKEAGLDYCKAIDIEPMRFDSHYNLAVLLRQLNRYNDSLNELQKAAMLIIEEPDSSTLQSAYIFNLLNEVSRKLISSDDYYAQKITDEPTAGISYTYVNGKIVPDEEFDKAILKNFRTCGGFEYFKDEEIDEDSDF